MTLVSVDDAQNSAIVADLTPTANWGRSHIRVELPAPTGNPPYGIVVENPETDPCPPTQFTTTAVDCPIGYAISSASPDNPIPQWGDRLKLTSNALVTNFRDFGVGSSVSLVQLNPADPTTAPAALQDLTPTAGDWKRNEIVTLPLSAVPLGAPGPLATPPAFAIRVNVPGASCTPEGVLILRPCPLYTVATLGGSADLWWKDQIAINAAPPTSFGAPDNGSSVKLFQLVRSDPTNPTSPLVVGQELNVLTPPPSGWTPATITTSLPPQPGVPGPYGLVVQVSATTPPQCPPQPLAVVANPLTCSRIPDLVRDGWRLQETLESGTSHPLIEFGPPLQDAIAPTHMVGTVGPSESTPLFSVVNRPDVPNDPLADNPLVQAVRTAGSPVKIAFGFVADTAGVSPHDYKPGAGALTFGGQLIDSLQLKTLLHPDVIPAQGSGPPTKTWSITLEAQVTLPGCSDPVQLELLNIKIPQLPLVIPSVATFFEDENFGGDALVVVKADTRMVDGLFPAPGVVLDDKTDPSGQLRTTQVGNVAAALTALSTHLDALSLAFQAVPLESRRLPDIGQIGRLGAMAGRLSEAVDQGRMVALVGQGESGPNLKEVYRRYDGPMPWDTKEDYAYIIDSMTLFGLPWQGQTDPLVTVEGLLVMRHHWLGFDFNFYYVGENDPKATLVSSWPSLKGTGKAGAAADWNDAFDTVVLRRVWKDY